MIEISTDIRKYINQSVLCWLATVDQEGMPNVSPKEIFDVCQEKIIIANIASPNTVNNIKTNRKVCVSFVDVLVQKGYQLKGRARVITNAETVYQEYESKLLVMTKGNFPFSSITEITVEKSKSILAPRYLLYPDTTEARQIETAKIQYQLYH